MKKLPWRNSLLLFLTALIWGVAFVAQSVGMDYVGAFTFSFSRCIIGGVVLIPCIWFLNRRKEEEPEKKASENRDKKAERRICVIGGVCCGIALFFASNLQQFGLKYTTVGKAGFITALYIILVPVLGIDYFSPKTDGVKMSCIQFFVCGILSGIAMLIFEEPSLGALLQAWMPILYAGVLSCGVAYTLQIVGQKDMDPTVASLILSLESVVSVLAGWVLLGQRLSLREISGCVLMFAAIILAQLPGKKPAGSVSDEREPA